MPQRKECSKRVRNGRRLAVIPSLLGVALASCLGSVAVAATPGVAGAAAGAAGAAAHASGAVWKVVPSADVSPTSEDQLTAVSCPRGSFCAAVGSSGSSTPLVEVYKAHQWTITAFADTSPPTLSALDGVSCTSARFCMAVGDADSTGPEGSFIKVPAAETWNGRAWQLIAVPTNPAASGIETRDQLTAVSCTSPTFCVASVVTEAVNFVGDEPVSTLLGYVETWNGSTWASTVSGNQPVAVSCVNPSLCAAVGTEGGANGGDITLGGESFADVFNGTTWTKTDFRLPSGYDNGLSGATLTSVACTTASCLAIGTQQLATETSPGTYTFGPVTTIDARYRRARWSTTKVPPPPMVTNGIACIEDGTCIGVGECTSSACGTVGSPLIDRYLSGSWSFVPDPVSSPSGTLDAVSCRSGSRCTGVGYQLAPGDRTLVVAGPAS